MQAEAIHTAKTVSEMKAGEKAVITAVAADEGLRAALAAHGLAVGAEIAFVKTAPLGDPVQLRVKGGSICLRRKDAARISVGPLDVRGGAEA